MAFAQLTYRDSLRDIEACLRAVGVKHYHLGFRCKKIARSTLAEANEKRDWKMYAFDASIIDLCLSVFSWAPFRKNKAAVKLHTLLDLKTNIPTFIEISAGAVHEVKMMSAFVPEQFAYYIMDRGFLDFKRLYRLHQTPCFLL